MKGPNIQNIPVRTPEGKAIRDAFISGTHYTNPPSAPPEHKFKVGDKVVYTNDFGVCWGVKTIVSLEYRPTTRDDDGPQRPTYHYEGTDTPWFSVDERNFTLAEPGDLTATAEELQAKYGFTPTVEQLGGCY